MLLTQSIDGLQQETSDMNMSGLQRQQEEETSRILSAHNLMHTNIVANMFSTPEYIPMMDISDYDQHSAVRQRRSFPSLLDLKTASELSFYHIHYVKNNISDLLQFMNIYSLLMGEVPVKYILSDVSGIFRPGMNAIIGQQGSGKTTLLDILADRKSRKGLTGEILINRLPPSRDFKKEIGYVVQHDVICGTLTVRENIMFSANIRLSHKIRSEQRVRRVEKVIFELGLESCANRIVDGIFGDGISNDERKRTCIGMELVLEPKFLFLDEPTTGLDIITARRVMNCLRRYANGGRIVIFSIHRPMYSIFKLFDTVTVLHNGFMFYHGPARNMMSHFVGQGYTPEANDNPADFVIDTLIDVSRDPKKIEQLRNIYKRSSMHRQILDYTKSHGAVDQIFETYSNYNFKKMILSFVKENFYLSQRTLKNTFRHPLLVLTEVIIAIILGLSIGLVFFDLKKTVDTGIQYRLSVMFIVVITQILATLLSLKLLIAERILFIHENASGYYRTFVYFANKLLCDILLVRTVETILFAIIAYFMVNLERDFIRFSIFHGTIFLASLYGAAVCLFVVNLIPILIIDAILILLIHFITILFMGYLILMKDVFNWLAWIQWVSAFRYAYNMLVMNEFRFVNFCQTNATNNCSLSGLQVLDRLDLHFDGEWDMWQNMFGLGMMVLGYFVLSYVVLLLIKKTK